MNIQTDIGRIKNTAGKMLYLAIPSWMKKESEEKIRAHFFQPGLNSGFLDKIIRRYINERYCRLSDSQKIDYSKYFWQGESGTSWIENKRDSYKHGKMEFFINRVRAPFIDMVTDYLYANRDYKSVLDVGTGSGQLCFDLLEKLGSGYKFTGIDLNKKVIERNIEQAGEKGISHIVNFECVDVSDWLRRQDSIDNMLVLSIATLKWFTKSKLLEFFVLVRQKCKTGAVALCEEVVPDFQKTEDPIYTGNLGFSHNYPALCRRAGYEIKNMRVLQIKKSEPGIRHIYLLAAF